ncbi:MAG TPA: TRAP transporter substrate-binding protein [Casimicrobiaceae bacterium]|jgi:TRAP-type C4-dicarboxylate transport system substrate-binding protein|nr:TRAP transporter substrate-binding protein [Casimicrobiaceae bacterium]
MSLRSLAAAALALAALPALAQEITLKVHHFWAPTAMPPSTLLVPWCDKIAKDSGNRLKCQIYPAMQLGGAPPQLIDQAKDGVADIVWTLPGYTSGRFPLMEVFELPFMSASAEATSQAAWEYFDKYARKEFPGIHMLVVNVHDNGYVHTREKQVKTMADFKGLKMRAPTRQTNKLLGALGATPVAMPLPALADALSKGVVDGYLLPWEVIPSIKAHELSKYDSETDPKMRALYTAVFTLAMNQAKYDSLPPDLKKVIDANSGLEAARAFGKQWDASAPPARKLAVERGNVFYTVPASELANWEKATANLDEEWVKDVTAKGNDGRMLLQSARDLIKKYEVAK